MQIDCLLNSSAGNSASRKKYKVTLTKLVFEMNVEDMIHK